MPDPLKQLRTVLASRFSAAAYHERLDAPPGSMRTLTRRLSQRLGAWSSSGEPGRRRFDGQSFNERLDRRGR
jgi:hypothetical protein